VAAALVVIVDLCPVDSSINSKLALVQVTTAEAEFIRATPVAAVEEVAFTVRVLVREAWSYFLNSVVALTV